MQNVETRFTTRVAIIVSNPIQHFCPFYRALTETGQIDLRVLFWSLKGSVPFFDHQFDRTVQWQAGLLDGFDSRFICETEAKTTSEYLHAWLRFSSELRDFHPTILVTYGLSTTAARYAMAWAIFHGIRVFYISDSPNFSKRTWKGTTLRRLLLPVLFRRVDAFLTVGESNQAFYRSMGVPAKVLHFCPLAVDEKLLGEAAQNRLVNRNRFIEQHSLPPDSFIVLFVGKLCARKRPADLIEALQLILERGHQNVHLFLAGDGPERVDLMNMTKLPVASNVHFLGFVPVTDLPALMSSADLLAQPSEYDPHPLAISEALFCGLPIVASLGVGSIGVDDELQPGVNGYSFDVGNISQIADSICSILNDSALHRRLSDSSLRISAMRNMKVSIQGFLSAIDSVR